MKKNYTTALFIFSIFTTILAVCLFIFFLKVINNKNQHTAAVLTTLGRSMQDKENAVIFAGKVSEIKSIQDSVTNYFVDKNKIDTFVDYLEKSGANFGSEVSVVSIEVPTLSKNTVTIKLSIVGKFQNVMNTVSYLENIPYQINITQYYLNKNIPEEVQVDPTKPKAPNVSTWEADVSFNILSLN